MKILKVTNALVIKEEIWRDPGDYPNNLAAGPLPDERHLIADGEMVIISDAPLNNDDAKDIAWENCDVPIIDWTICSSQLDLNNKWVTVLFPEGVEP